MPDRIDRQPTILLVGTGHWSNPGKDYKSVEFDDMLALPRQREIADCPERLARFSPTKVALEVMADQSEAVNEDYRLYRAGSLTLTANERHQLGFRLAAMLGHERIFGIDWHNLDRPIGWDQAIAFAQEHGQLDRIAFFTRAEQADEQDRAAERDCVRQMSVRDQLLEINDPERMAEGHQIYMDLAQVGDGNVYIGADVVLRWYERNMTIFVNLSRIATDPDDRVLVVIGGGHLPLLTHFIESSRRFGLVPASKYLI